MLCRGRPLRHVSEPAGAFLMGHYYALVWRTYFYSIGHLIELRLCSGTCVTFWQPHRPTPQHLRGGLFWGYGRWGGGVFCERSPVKR